MAVRNAIEQTEGMYFNTFTCQFWLPLFEITKGIDTVYKGFDYLKTEGHEVKGYVPDSFQDVQSFTCIN